MSSVKKDPQELDLTQLAQTIKQWGRELGFSRVGIADADLSEVQDVFLQWLEDKFHGEMHYLERHAKMRLQPEALLPGTVRIIVVSMDYLPEASDAWQVLADPEKAYVSRYALGRDYHKLIRKRLQQLALRIQEQVGPYQYRAFADSAPVLEKPLAQKAGLGWIGKHTNLIHHQSGSWFFLGTLYTDLPLPIDEPSIGHCGTCTRCMTVCPTQAIIAPFKLDARRCISYLTIELAGAIPVALRPLIGNRVYGCDDCQLVCPWNKFAKFTREPDFAPRHDLDSEQLLVLFHWTETEFLTKTQGSAIRRIGYMRWLRNLSVALGNAPYQAKIVESLRERYSGVDAMVQEHISWAIAEQIKRAEEMSGR